MTGCYGPNGSREKPCICGYCYAYKIASRFRGGKAFPNGFEPTFYPERLKEARGTKAGEKVFVCSMSDLFGGWVSDEKIETILDAASSSKATYIFLTKHPGRLVRFNPWPNNCWVGATATTAHALQRTLPHLYNVDAKVRFVSFEPLLSSMWDNQLADGFMLLDWIIIGAQTNPTKLPHRKWIEDIECAAALAKVPVFEKNNLKLLFDRELRQEFPG